MGTLTIATFMTLDGIMQAPGGPDEDRDGGFEHGGWSFPYFSDDMGEVIGDAFGKAECFLLGRRTYEIFAASWPNFPDKDDPVASRLNTLPKYVVSTTLENADWQPTTIIRGDIPAEVAKLKDQYDGEIQVHGSAAPGPDAARPRPHRRVPAVHRAGRARHRQAAVRARRGADRPAAGREQADGQGDGAGHLPTGGQAHLRRVPDGGRIRPPGHLTHFDR